MYLGVPVYSGWRKNSVFVRVETDGDVGWGEAYTQYDRDRAIAAQIEELGRYLVGRDPTKQASNSSTVQGGGRGLRCASGARHHPRVL